MKSMKRSAILLVLLFIFMNAHCQEKKENPDVNTYQVNLGADVGYCKYNININNPSYNQDTTFINDAFDIIRLYADYSITRMFSLGISWEYGGLLTKPTFDFEPFYDQLSINNIGIIAKFKLIFKAKTHIYFDLLPVFSWLDFQKKGFGSTFEYKYNGFGFQLALGVNQFFGKHIGMNIRPFYTKSNYKSEILVSNINQAGMQAQEFKYNGFGLGLGIIIKL